MIPSWMTFYGRPVAIQMLELQVVGDGGVRENTPLLQSLKTFF